MKTDYAASVFINCPFDAEYRALLFAKVFAVFDCGYLPRCSQEIEDGGEVRIEKIRNIIRECKFGVHDISRIQVNGDPPLPRFNMPFELGLFVGARIYGGGDQKKKVCLILDADKYRYQRSLSDIAGHDIQEHGNDPEIVIKKIRNWLQNATQRKTIPGGHIIVQRYRQFMAELPGICDTLNLQQDTLLFNEFALIVETWLKKKDPD
ncbi:hypothetical protein [Lysobacter antibioticus]|uniref:hypothetical protein n=1 Tax=Lysobacter antibioticus TaxID=84531 RepID=UPI0009E96E62|nr:hypothetical protein [Lysobacter antibioticus]